MKYKYVVICEYPYETIKKFFNDIVEVNLYAPEINPYSITNKLLNCRAYLLTSYSETVTKENRIVINYNVDLQTCIRK